MILFTYLIAFIPIIIIYAMMPFLTRRDNLFGVSAPTAFYKDPIAKKMRAMYSLAVLFVGAIFMLVIVFTYDLPDAQSQPIVLTVELFAMLFIMGAIYLAMRKKAKAIKQKLKWQETAEPALVTDTTFYSKKLAVSRLWFLAYAIIIIATIALGFYFYASLPDQVPMNTAADGAVSYMDKSMKLIFFMPIIQLIVAGSFALGYYSIKKARPELSASAVKRSAQQNIKHRYAWSSFLVFNGLAMVLLFLFVQLEIFGVVKGITMIASFVLVGIMLVGAVALAVIFGQSGSRIKGEESGEKQDKVLNRDDDKYWKMGMFYVNRDDPSLFVEKRFGIGFTLNFGRPLGWIVLGVIAIVVIGSIIISK